MGTRDSSIYHIIPITQHYDSDEDDYEEEDDEAVGGDLSTENVADAPPAESSIVEHPNVDDATFQHLLKYSTWNALQHSVATLVLIHQIKAQHECSTTTKTIKDVAKHMDLTPPKLKFIINDGFRAIHPLALNDRLKLTHNNNPTYVIPELPYHTPDPNIPQSKWNIITCYIYIMRSVEHKKVEEEEEVDIHKYYLNNVPRPPASTSSLVKKIRRQAANLNIGSPGDPDDDPDNGDEGDDDEDDDGDDGGEEELRAHILGAEDLGQCVFMSDWLVLKLARVKDGVSNEHYLASRKCRNYTQAYDDYLRAKLKVCVSFVCIFDIYSSLNLVIPPIINICRLAGGMTLTNILLFHLHPCLRNVIACSPLNRNCQVSSRVLRPAFFLPKLS
jgi:hypothetical protein